MFLPFASTKVRVNGIQGNRMCHARGLCWGGGGGDGAGEGVVSDALPIGHGMP